MTAPKKFYRFSEYPIDNDRVEIDEEAFTLKAETPKGYWITDELGYLKKFILKDGTSKFADWNRLRAFNKFKKRKKLHLSFLESRTKYIKKVINYIPAFEKEKLI